VVIQPPGCLHPRHQHIQAPLIELNPLQLLDVSHDEIEQRQPDFVRISRPEAAMEA
jgi:hypothetical protein